MTDTPWGLAKTLRSIKSGSFSRSGLRSSDLQALNTAADMLETLAGYALETVQSTFADPNSETAGTVQLAALKAGIVRQEPYDPAVHGDDEFAETGDPINVFTEPYRRT